MGKRKMKDTEKSGGGTVFCCNTPSSFQHKIDPAEIFCKSIYNKTFFPVRDHTQNNAKSFFFHIFFFLYKRQLKKSSGRLTIAGNAPFAEKVNTDSLLKTFKITS